MTKTNNKITLKINDKKKTRNQPKKKNGNNNTSTSEITSLIKKMFQPVVMKSAVPRLKERGESGFKFSLSKAAMKLALAIADPFNPSSDGVCMPTYPSILSRRCRGFSRFNFATGSNGLGFFMVTPTLGNDGVMGFYTNSAFSGTNILALSGNNTLATGISTVLMGNLPYTQSQLKSQTGSGSQVVEGRIICIGVRVQYADSTLNMAGMEYLYHSPDHLNATVTPGTAATPSSIPILGNYRETEVVAVTRDPIQLNIFPVRIRERQFGDAAGSNASTYCYPYSNDVASINDGYTYSDGQANVGCPVAIFAISAGTGGLNFHVEMVAHVEYTGPVAASDSYPSEVDEDGMDQVLCAASRIPELKQSQPNSSDWELMRQGLATVAKAAAPHPVPQSEKALASFFN